MSSKYIVAASKKVLAKHIALSQHQIAEKVRSNPQRIYADNNDLQCLIGYMIPLFPENFSGLGRNYIEVKRIGDVIIEEVSSEAPLVKVICTDEKADKYDILMALAYVKKRLKKVQRINFPY